MEDMFIPIFLTVFSDFSSKGQNVKNKVSTLMGILDNYDLDTLIEFFQEQQMQ